MIVHVPIDRWIKSNEGSVGSFPHLSSFPIVRKSRMATPRRRFQSRFRLPYPLSPLSSYFFMTASVTVLLLLRLTEGFWSSVAALMSIRLLYNLVAGDYGMPIHLGK